MIKSIIRIILFIIIAFLLYILISKIYQFIILSKVHNEIEKFANEENRCYSAMQVVRKPNREIILNNVTCLKDNKVKYSKVDMINDITFVEFKDFLTNEKFVWKNGESVEVDVLYVTDKKIVKDVSNVLYPEFDIKKLMKVRSIVTTEHNGKDCYEILTDTEMIIVSKDTYLPEYACEYADRLNEKDKIEIEYFYKFEVGTVTDEDMQVPQD